MFSGLELSLALTTLMLVSFALAPDMYVGDYPPDIRAKFGKMSARSARMRPYVAVMFFAVAMGIPLAGLYQVRADIGTLTFSSALVFSLVALLTFNVYDLLILDWLVVCTLRPRWFVLPGTEGMAGYRDYRFHFVGFLIGLGFCAVGAVMISLVWLGVEAFLL